MCSFLALNVLEMLQDTCLVCPGRTFTVAEGGASNKDQCKGEFLKEETEPNQSLSAQCRPGTYSKDGLEQCRTCSAGSFQMDYAETKCQMCNDGFSTLFRGANSPEQCKAKCAPGKTSETGLEPCFPCPKGYFQPDEGTQNCFKCPNKVPVFVIFLTSKFLVTDNNYIPVFFFY